MFIRESSFRGPFMQALTPTPFVIWLACGLLVATSSNAAVVDRIRAIVGSEIILQSELKDKSLDDAISQLILKNECKKQSLTPTEDEIQQQIKEIKEQNHLSEPQFQAAIAGMNMTMAAYKEQLGAEACKMKIAQYKIRPRVQISKDDVEQAWRQEYVGNTEKRLQISEILIAPTPGAKPKVVQNIAKQIYQDLKNGEPWDKVVNKTYSSEVQVQAEDLGIVKKGDLQASISDIAFAEDPSPYRAPFQTSVGFHILKVEDTGSVEQIPLGKVEKDLHKKLFSQEVERLLKQYLDDLRNSTFVEVHDG